MRNGLIQYFEFGKDAPLATECHGIEHGGKDWIISKDRTQIFGVHCHVRNFIVKKGVSAIVRWFVPFSNNSYRTMTGGQYGRLEVFAKVSMILCLLARRKLLASNGFLQSSSTFAHMCMRSGCIMCATSLD